MNKDEGDKRSRDNPWRHPNKEKEEEMRLWGILVFGLIGATVTTFAVTQLRSTIGWIYSQMSRSQSSRKNGNSFRTSFQEEARKRYNRRMREEYEAEMERVERIRRMQSVFNRERNKFRRRHDSWQEYGPGAYHQHFQRNDWYWKEDASFRDEGSYYRETPKTSASSPLSHHYSVLGLNSQPLEQRQRNFTLIRIKTIKNLLKQNSRKLWRLTRLSSQKGRTVGISKGDFLETVQSSK